MALQLASLNSGSNGNCYYVGNEQDAVLIDAGISCREIERRMARLDLPMSRLRAIFISHEHSDHIRGLPTLLKRYRLPLYITPPTFKGSGLYLYEELMKDFSGQKSIAIGSLLVQPFSKIHDAADPYSFTISCEGVNVGIFTDLGRVCTNLATHFSQCHAAVLESNYDEEMLEKGGYPWHLKQRIRGGQGHLSNREALELFLANKHAQLTHLLLGHLSQNNNEPTLVAKLFAPHAGNVEIIIASRYAESKVLTISAGNTVQPHHFAKPPEQLLLDF